MTQALKSILFERLPVREAATLEDLRAEVDHLQVCVLALANLLVDRAGVAPQELADSLLRADLQSGHLDGRVYARGALPDFRCSSCGQPGNQLLGRCPFCEAQFDDPVDPDTLPKPPKSGRKVVISDPGDTPFLYGEHADSALVDWENQKALLRRKKPATFD